MPPAQKLECLCPQCLTTMDLPESADYHHDSSIDMHCEACLTPFEVVVTNGIKNTKNVIVLG